MRRFEGLYLLSGLYKLIGLALFIGAVAYLFYPAFVYRLLAVIAGPAVVVLVGGTFYGVGLLINVVLNIEADSRVTANYFRQRVKADESKAPK